MADIPTNVTTQGPTYLPSPATATTWRMNKVGIKSTPVDRHRSKAYRLVFQKYNFQKVVNYEGQLPEKGYLSPDAVSWQETHTYRNDVFSDLSSMSTTAKRTYNRAYAKLVERFRGDGADMLALVAERKAAGAMIYNRLFQFAQLTDESVNLHKNGKKLSEHSDWRKKPVRRLLKQREAIIARISAITATTPSGVFEKTKSLRRKQGILVTPAELILEMRWGWLPMVSDVYTACSTFERNPSFPIRGNDWHRIVVDKKVGSSPSMVQTVEGKLKIACGGDLLVDSGVLGELERLGISNPLQALWEITPYSWLIDWFSNVGDFISSLDDNLIVKLTNVYVTRTAKTVEKGTFTETWGGFKSRQYEREGVYMNRITPATVPRPLMVVHMPDMSFWRWATLSSLIVLKLKKVKPLLSLGR